MEDLQPDHPPEKKSICKCSYLNFKLKRNVTFYIIQTCTATNRSVTDFILLFLADHLEQPLSMPHEEKRKLSKGFQNGISPSDPSTQTFIKEVQTFRETSVFHSKDKFVIKACSIADQLQVFA